MGEFGGAGGNAADARGKTGTELAAYGRTSKEIAAELGSSPDDVRRHLHSIFTKLNDSRPPDPLLPRPCPLLSLSRVSSPRMLSVASPANEPNRKRARGGLGFLRGFPTGADRLPIR